MCKNNIVKDKEGTSNNPGEMRVRIDMVLHTSDFARFFDDTCPSWTEEAEFNLIFLRQKQMYANSLLKAKGHLFLNDVYDLIGIPRTKAGTIVGWIYNENDPNCSNFIDFGLYDTSKSKFVNGYNPTILLDFNVDGPILDLI